MGIIVKMSKDEVDQDCTEMEGTRLQKAVEEAEKTMKLTPIIKEELRLSILNRRCKENKGDIVIEEKKPLIKTELTPEEIRKKLRRRQQNKDAARRCRAKKKRLESTVITDYFREQARTKELQEEVTSLKQTLAQLTRLLDDHAFSCQLTQAQSPPFNQAPSFTFPVLGETNTCFNSENLTYDRQVHNATPLDQLEDPFYDPALQYADAMLYPLRCDVNNTPDFKRESVSTCTVTSQESLEDDCDHNLPSDLMDLNIPDSSVFQQPCSPDLYFGRQSISDEYCPEYCTLNN